MERQCIRILCSWCLFLNNEFSRLSINKVPNICQGSAVTALLHCRLKILVRSAFMDSNTTINTNNYHPKPNKNPPHCDTYLRMQTLESRWKWKVQNRVGKLARRDNFVSWSMQEEPEENELAQSRRNEGRRDCFHQVIKTNTTTTQTVWESLPEEIILRAEAGR